MANQPRRVVAGSSSQHRDDCDAFTSLSDI